MAKHHPLRTLIGNVVAHLSVPNIPATGDASEAAVTTAHQIVKPKAIRDGAGQLFWLMIGVLLLCGHQVFAQTPPPKSTPRQAAAQSAYLTTPLPNSVDTVGPNFKGHDIVSIVAELKRSPMGAPKSEFETTPQYEQRLRSLLEARSRKYVFVLGESTATANYSADTKVMIVSITAPFVGILFDSDNRVANDPSGDSDYFSSGFALRSISHSPSLYVATNAFGVKVNVIRFTGDEFGVVLSRDQAMFTDVEPCCDHIGTRESTISLDMDVEMAKVLKPFLRVALVCTLVNPVVYEGTGRSTPTISSPVEVSTRQQYLLVHPDEMWAYDRRSGKVLGKVMPK